MKSLKMLLVAALLFSTATACKKKFFGINGKGDLITETRSTDAFDKIDLSIDANVIYVQDSVYSIRVTGQANILEVLTTTVSNNKLLIDYSRNVWKAKQVTIEVHSPNIREMELSGSGNITVEGAVTTDNLQLGIYGSGNISIPSVTADDITAKISGSGNMSITAGTTNTQSYDISGSGNINAEDLVSNRTDAEISGSGSITVHALQLLNASISGSGDVRYHGNPVMNVNISGSGSVIHLD